MIYFTTFIFTLLLAHIARAVPGCGDVASPQGLYDINDDKQLVFAGDNVTWDAKYDNMDSSTKSIACSGLGSKYPHFHNFPDFPYIGSAFDIIGHDSCTNKEDERPNATTPEPNIGGQPHQRMRPGIGNYSAPDASTTRTGILGTRKGTETGRVGPIWVIRHERISQTENRQHMDQEIDILHKIEKSN